MRLHEEGRGHHDQNWSATPTPSVHMIPVYSGASRVAIQYVMCAHTRSFCGMWDR